MAVTADPTDVSFRGGGSLRPANCICGVGLSVSRCSFVAIF